jgi:hypothetical protein
MIKIRGVNIEASYWKKIIIPEIAKNVNFSYYFQTNQKILNILKNPKNPEKSQIFQCRRVAKFWSFVSHHKNFHANSQKSKKFRKNLKNSSKILKFRKNHGIPIFFVNILNLPKLP